MAMKMGMKRGMFFTTDALIASGILVMAVLLANNFYSFELQNDDVVYGSTDTLRLLASIKASDSKNAYVLAHVQNGTIYNLNNSLLVQIGEFWMEGRKSHAGNMTANLTSEMIPESLSYSVEIGGDTVYMRNLSNPKILANAKTLISGIMGTDLWGPISAEVKVWR